VKHFRRSLLVPPLLLAAACGGSDPTVATSATAGPSPSSTRSPAAPSATSSAAPVPSPPGSSAAAATGATPGDVDGDGGADTVTVTATTLAVALSGGGRATAPIVDAQVPPRVSGLFDVDRDGHAEVFVETARGASTGFVQIYRYDGRSLRELTFDGAPIRFGIGGSVTHGDGFACTGSGQLVVRSAESDDGSTYRVRSRIFRISGASVQLQSDTTVTAPSMDDARVRQAYQVDCGAVGEGD
jgi:hypothetical protein